MAGSPVDVFGIELFENFMQNFKIRLNDQVAGSAVDSSEADRNGSRVKISSENEQHCLPVPVFCQSKLKYARCVQDAQFIEDVKSQCCDGNSNFTKECPSTMKAFRNRATNNLCKDDGSLDPEWFGADTKGNGKLCFCSMVFSSCDYVLAKTKQFNDQQLKDRVFSACCKDDRICPKEKKKFDELFPQSCKNFHAGALTDPKSAPASQTPALNSSQPEEEGLPSN